MNTEHIRVKIFKDAEQASIAVAKRIVELIREKNSQGCQAVLGLATGHTPINVYKELIRRHKKEGLDLSNVVTFNLDEYWPIKSTAVQSYCTWMHENFFDHVNIPKENVHILKGDIADEDIAGYCQQYEHDIEAAGGIDLQILGIGRSGHIGFNEPGSPRDSTTRLIRLDKITRKDAASDFFGEENVPEMALTMGVGTIFKVREICLMAFGEQKAAIVHRAVEGEVTARVAASFLQEHPNATFYLDIAAAAQLTRIATPWLMGECNWDEALKVKAVVWLARKLSKPINKLTAEDYDENGLTELLEAYGGVQEVNRSVFRRLMGTITTRPAGKENRRRVLVFSPHPDDDVICMAGTLMRLVIP